MDQRIVIDGKVYNRVDEMPPDVRSQYEAAMRGVNFNSFQPAAPQAVTGNFMSAATFVVDGQTYNSLDQLPPEARAKYEQAMGALDTNRNGVPDFVEGMLTNRSAINTPVPDAAPAPLRSQPKPAAATIEPESSGGWVLAILGVVLAGACLLLMAGGAWYFFMR